MIERGFKRHVGQPKRDSAGGKDIVFGERYREVMEMVRNSVNVP